MSPRLRLWLLVVPVAIGIVAGYVGAALHPTLAVENPTLLIALNPRNYHLALVATEISFWVFASVAFVRLVINDPLVYALGWYHGDAGRAWLERQTEGAANGILGFLDRWFPKVGWLIVFAAPNQPVCLLAGVTRMRPAVFGILNVTGTVVRIGVIWWLAQQFEDVLDAILDFFRDYQTPVTVAAIVVVVAQIAWSSRKGGGELSDLRELEHEIEHEIDDDTVAAPVVAEGTADELAASDLETSEDR